MDIFRFLETRAPAHCDIITDPVSGLRAIVVLDDLSLGPATGGIRTAPYESLDAALTDALELASAMTTKCALAGLPAGGAKVVVIDRPELRREAAFAYLGRRIEELNGALHTAGDYGTTQQDLVAAALHTRFVHTGTEGFTAAAGKGVVRAIEACLALRGEGQLAGLRVAVQGCGAIGRAVARELAAVGASLVVCDANGDRAKHVAEMTSATICDPADFFTQDVDVLSPCALGGVLDEAQAASLRAWAVVGGANNILARPAAEDVLVARKVLFVPDTVSSAGAVIDGVGRVLMGLDNTDELVDGISATACRVLEEARSSGRRASDVARETAWKRVTEARDAK